MIVQMVKDLYSALKSFLSTITEKIMNFRRKGIENNLMKKFPEQLKFLPYEQQEKENIEFCRNWYNQRKWCLENHLEISDIKEELIYQEILEKYRFDKKKKLVEL